jgi:hypothetical protein
MPPAPTLNPPALYTRFALSSNAPEVPARTTLSAVKSLTVAEAKVASPDAWVIAPEAFRVPTT